MADAVREPVASLPAVSTPPFDPEPDRERWRHRLAFSLVLMVAATIAAGFVWIAARWGTEADIKDLLAVILTPLVALTGSALGFYFGGRTHN